MTFRQLDYFFHEISVLKYYIYLQNTAALSPPPLGYWMMPLLGLAYFHKKLVVHIINVERIKIRKKKSLYRDRAHNLQISKHWRK